MRWSKRATRPRRTRHVRVFIIRGAGGAFAAGTDITQFRDFRSGDDGVAYERRLDAIVERVERMKLPTIAEVDGPAVGGGCAIAMACDFRICSERARFGVPVARTLGNCLSMANTARLVDMVGTAQRARHPDWRPAARRRRGVGGRTGDRRGAIGSPRNRGAQRWLRSCPLRASTIAATKEMLRRLRDHRRPDSGVGDDIVRDCYGSEDFSEGVAAFVEKRPPRWR